MLQTQRHKRVGVQTGWDVALPVVAIHSYVVYHSISDAMLQHLLSNTHAHTHARIHFTHTQIHHQAQVNKTRSMFFNVLLKTARRQAITASIDVDELVELAASGSLHARRRDE